MSMLERWIRSVSHTAEMFIRARQWAPWELAVLAVVSLVVAWFVVDAAVDGLAALRARLRLRRVWRISHEGVSRHADPGRVHRETAGHVDRLAGTPASRSDAGAARA